MTHSVEQHRKKAEARDAALHHYQNMNVVGEKSEGRHGNDAGEAAKEHGMKVNEMRGM
jgi:hypothetical protein